MTPVAAPTAELIRVGDVTLDVARQVVRRGGDDLRLRPKTFDVLTVLVRHAGQVVSKQRLIEMVWGDVAVTDDSLVQCLVEIRRALGDGHGVIRTVRGRGYLLDAEVEHLARSPAASGLEPVVPAAADRPDGGVDPGVQSRPVPPRRGWVVGTIAATAVVAGLAVVALPGSRPGSSAGPSLQETMIPEARQALDEGLTILRTSRAQVDLLRARQLFERTVALDSGYAAGHAALGNVQVMLSAFGVRPPLDLLPGAAAAARRAVALDPTLAAGWQALAHVQTQAEWDWPAAEQSYRRAIALDPAAPLNMVFAHLLAGVGRLDDAVAESDRLLVYDAESPTRLGSNCIVKYLARRLADALDACDRAVAIDPEYSTAHFWRALVLSSLGRHDEAMSAALASRRAMGFVPTWVVGYVHARAGRLAEAREVLRAIETRADGAYVPPIDVAFLLAAVGDHGGALDWLERGYRERGRWLELLAVHAAADPLRGEPRFRALLKALRLPELS